MNYNPIGSKVVIKVDELPQEMSNGLLRPHKTKGDTGTVIAISPDYDNFQVEVGDRVKFIPPNDKDQWLAEDIVLVDGSEERGVILYKM